jgi:ADP-L-glycero-D-manno-heptose 6-epimerase
VRYVVTGGAGFIGSNVVAQIERRGLGEVAVVDPLRDERWRNISKRRLSAVITDHDQFFQYLDDDCPDDTTIIHMGARTSTDDADVEALVKTNTQLTVDLFRYCRERFWPFVYASSASVYGASQRQAEADDEGSAPLNPYAWSKLTADNIIRSVASLDGGYHLLGARSSPSMWVGLRLFNVYGPGEQHKGEQKSFVSRCFDAIAASQPITVFRGSDAFVRDWVYVEDVARLVCDILTGPMPHEPPLPFGSGVYNVGTGSAVSFIDVAKACIEASGTITPLETVAFPTGLNGRYQSYTKADTARLKAAAPYFQFTPLAEGVAAYWRDYASRKGDARHP